MHMRVNNEIVEKIIRLFDWYFYWMNLVKNVKQKFVRIKRILLLVKWTFSEYFIADSSLDMFLDIVSGLSN